MGQEVETEVPRAAEAGLYTGEDKGRLCALVRAQLVRAQLVRAQHADTAPGAIQRSRVRAREKEKIKKWLDAVPTRDITPPSTAHDLMRGPPAHLPPGAAACFSQRRRHWLEVETTKDGRIEAARGVRVFPVEVGYEGRRIGNVARRFP
ncbi:hypothetical protein IEO21_10917 [Rhodonia placenta]|uniref:Uncharacterized protein n=1 Tax=Rhodonia placenta TaxID=104341 RepID=A0A8H7NRK2_9APHY|nr:hypothetical protein IEO21_10917 [Postia placenta]